MARKLFASGAATETSPDVSPEAPPQATETPRRRRFGGPTSEIGRQQERLGWMLVAPSILIVLAVAIYPLFETFRLSFTNARLASPREVSYVGARNYELLIQDSQFWTALSNTFIFTFSSVALELILGMVIALTIHSAFAGRGLVRTSMLVPWAIPTVVSAILWNWMFHDVFGVINEVLRRVNLIDSNVAWLANPATSLGAIVAIDVWKTTPFMALLLLAGLQIIPGDVYEASRVDGASKWQSFWRVTLPLLRPAILVALVFRTLDAFRVFDIIWVLKAGATDTMSIAVYTYQSLVQSQQLGRGSAAAVVIFVCVGALVVLYTRLIKVEET